ncbi:kinase-like domain-containing protein [Rhizophagus clarus]|uniref:Kinase-like domain-containing protein n=1 Tax=Rhizophagus clarus TaxID=94130 RepID=A0A8H3R564_9GLOM|nr:kinase-like domain-containing protein [Rhizophagus clarus]
MEAEFSKFNISDSDEYSNSEKINYGNCSYCNKSFTKELWCKECDPIRMINGWTSGNNDIDKFIKDTIYDRREYGYGFVEWIPFDKFEDIEQIGEGGFAKVYSATWVDGETRYEKQDDGNWKKEEPKPKKVALKRLNGSQNMSIEYLNELKTHWEFCKSTTFPLKLFGITKDPETKEFMMNLEYADGGSLRNVLLNYDFGLSGPSNKQKSDKKICGVLPYIAPEILNGEPYTLSSDIYSFGVIMAELSSGKPSFYKRKHDISLALDICNGLRPEFGKGTPEFYKKIAHKCMDANSNQRPTANELYDIVGFWFGSLLYTSDDEYQEKEKFGYKGKDIKAIFEEADKEIPNISTSYEKDPDAIYSSRVFTFNNLTTPVNSSIIAPYLGGNQDSKLIDLEISNSFLDDVNKEISSDN